MRERAVYPGKRMLDLALALPLSVLALLPAAAVALAILARMGRPVLFRQSRAGRGGEPFMLFKFRTMRDADGRPDAERITRLGRFLRSTSLDELPQLWNVVRGDMSLVGPRPLPPEYVERYSPEQAIRLEVPPGLTGLAQVSGRNGISWDRKFALDRAYVEGAGPLLDLRILARTLIVVLGRSGVSADGHATMPEFEGVAPGSGSTPDVAIRGGLEP